MMMTMTEEEEEDSINDHLKDLSREYFKLYYADTSGPTYEEGSDKDAIAQVANESLNSKYP